MEKETNNTSQSTITLNVKGQPKCKNENLEKTEKISKNKITIISGPKNSGKTARMLELYKELALGNGVASIKIFNSENLHIGYDFLLLRHKKSIPLARLTDLDLPGFRNKNDIILQGQYSFRKSAFNEVIKMIDYSCPIWLDELGNLEVEGKGFAPIIEKAMEMHSELIVVVRRSALLDILFKYFQDSAPTIIRVQ